MNIIKKHVSIFLIVTIIMAFVPIIDGGAFASTKKPAKVVITLIVVDANVISIAWGKAKYAKKYQVANRTSYKTWKYWKKVKKNSTNYRKYNVAGKYKTVKNGKYYKVYKYVTKHNYKVLKSTTGKWCKYRGQYSTDYTIVVRGVNGKKKGKWSTAQSVKTEAEPDDPSAGDVSREWQLQDGYYTAGIDIPAGTFDVTATAGAGYISSDFDGANLCGPGYDDPAYSRTFKNYILQRGELLEVAGVQVTLNYSTVKSNVTGRTYDEDASVVLYPGNYLVGRDIAAGRYNIRYVSGNGGYVDSNRDEGDCIVSSNMDGDPSTGDYCDFVSNILLVNGETIHVTSGLTVRFIPEQQ